MPALYNLRPITRRLRSLLVSDLRWANLQHRLGRLSLGDYYDRLTELVMRQALPPDAVCIDVGCHEGDILRLMMKHAPQGYFVAFEPIPTLHAKLREDFHSSQVSIHHLALSDSTGNVTFNHVVTNPAYSGIRKRRYDRADEQVQEITVMTDTLDNVLEREAVRRVTFIKVDVEGAEYLVLKGAAKTIAKDKPVIVFEHGIGGADCYENGPEDLHDLLVQRCGLQISLLPDYLANQPSLTRAAFCDQFHQRRNFYFIAHPG